jgi:hypothetical protein
VPPSFLKHADEQTVACLAAVLEAIAASNLAPEGPGVFARWAAVCGPRFIGRDVIAQAVPNFRTEGPWGVSPHVIPHRSLHSPSGALSVALGIQGPNLGAGGGNGSEAEALLTALTLLWGQKPPGVWLVTSSQSLDGVTEACALALASDGEGPVLSLRIGHQAGEPFSLASLLAGRPCVVPGLGRATIRSLRHAALR